MSDDEYLGAGKLIVFSTGEYSDYGYRGMFVTLRPLLRSQLREIGEEVEAHWKRLDAEQDAWTKESGLEYPILPGKHELFQTRLIEAGMLLVIDYNEMHIGSYSELDLSL